MKNDFYFLSFFLNLDSLGPDIISSMHNIELCNIDTHIQMSRLDYLEEKLYLCTRVFIHVCKQDSRLQLANWLCGCLMTQ